MNRKTTKAIALLVAAAMLLATFSMIFSSVGMLGQEGCYAYGAVNTTTNAGDEASLDVQLAGLKTYLQYIKANYKDSVSYKTLVQGAYKGALSGLDDPYSSYYATKEAENSFVQAIKGVFGGIGVVAQSNDKGQCRILEIKKNMPAYRAGIKLDDWIIKVDDVDVTNLTGPEIIMRIRGEIGTSVSLTVNRGGIEQRFTMVREEIKEDSVFVKMLPDKIGYMEITSFDDDGDLEFAQKRGELLDQGAVALILDLRDNRGGLIDTSIKMINQLTDKQLEVLHYRQQDKILKTIKTDGTGMASSIPVVVLVNENTASAGEIFVAAIQDNKLATLVGTVTYGKGVAQQVADLSNGTGLKLSVYYFLRPNKQDIHKVGIMPDYVVKNPVKVNSEELKSKYNGFAPMSEKKKYSKGGTGLNVYGAQQRLALMGYSVKATGTLDKDTEAALKAFQKESGLSSYGGLDYSTMEKLNNAAAAYILSSVEGDAQLDKAISLLKERV